MNKQNLWMFLLALIFTFAIFPIGVQAITYRTDLDNGSWNDYKTNLTDDFYLEDFVQANYNREFENFFDLNGVTVIKCDQYFCYYSPSTTGNYVERDASEQQTGSYSAHIHSGANQRTDFWGLAELVGDVNISFYYKSSGADSCFRYGYLTDSNSWVGLGSLPEAADWTYSSYTVPAVTGKWGFEIIDDATFQVCEAYVDNVTVTRNNAGTFYKNVSPANCGSIAACSNVDALSSNEVRHLYWYVDYLTSASCSWSEDGVNKGAMTPSSNGMYYGLIDTLAYPASDVNVALSATCTKTGYDTRSFYATPDILNDANSATTLTTSNTSTNDIVLRGSTISFYSTYKDDLGNYIEDANCYLNSNAMSYNSTYQRYEYSETFVVNGVYSVVHACSKNNFQSQTDNYSLRVMDSATSALTVIPISGISDFSKSDYNNEVSFDLSSNNEVVFEVISTSEGYTPLFKFDDGLEKSKQFFVYTSNNGSDWVFSDSLTYGDSANFDNPIQKIWLGNHYVYSFSDSLSQDTPKYYKLDLKSLPAYWEVTKNSVDWVNINEPTSFVDSNSKTWDLFQDSNYTNIKTYSIKKYPELTSSDFNTGFEVQFTAFASTGTDIKVGYLKDDGSDSTDTITLTTTPTRYSVPVTLTDWNSSVLIKSTSSVNARVYLTDYAVIPKSYFLSRLEVVNLDGSKLSALVRNSVSYEYVKEGVPFRIDTKAFDKDNDLRLLRVEALIGTVVLKSYDLSIDTTDCFNNLCYFSQNFDGVIDLNGVSSYLGVFTDLRNFTVRATLINSSGETVAEQFKTVKLLQYPYFSNDITFTASAINKKVGTHPSFNFSLSQIAPEMFIGVEVSIYDGNHSVTSPNFKATIYVDELDCTTLAYCQKNITFDEYAWEAENTYTARFTLILKTESKSYTNYLTTRPIEVLTTLAQLETARVLQVFERRDRQYTNTEEIPLVFQVRDDTCQNLQNQLVPYMKISVFDGVDTTNYSNVFFPEKFIFDDTTCYNYWYWNRIFYTDSGDLIPDGNSIIFKVFALKPSSTHSTSSLGYTLANKCATGGYPSDFFNGSLIMNWIGFVGDASYGCTDLSDPVVTTISGDAETIDINNLYSPSALQNQSVFCYKSDSNRVYKQDLGDELICGVWFLKSEQQIDGFKIIIGNAYSDYSKTGSEAQYLSFDIPAEQVIFNDVLILRAALETEFETDRINTMGELLNASFNKLLPYGQGVVDFTQDKLSFIQGVGADINLSEQLNPNKISGLFFFKVSGLKTINQLDYVKSYPELAYISPTNLRSFLISKGVRLPNKEATIIIYNNSFTSSPFKVSSPLVIFEQPSSSRFTQSVDANGQIIPTQLKLNFISDMYSNNQATVQRSYVPLSFSYIVPDVPFNWEDFVTFTNDLWENPLGVVGDWFWKYALQLAVLLAVLLIVSVVYLNFKSGGGVQIFFNKNN